MQEKGKAWARSDEINRAFSAAWDTLSVLDRRGALDLTADDLANLRAAGADLCEVLREKLVSDALARAAVRLKLPSAKACGLETVHCHMLLALVGQMVQHRPSEWPLLAGQIDNQNLAVRLQQESLAALEEAEEVRQQLAVLRTSEPSNHSSDAWTEEDAPSEWAKRLGISLSTLKRRVGSGEIRVEKVTRKSWRLHRENLPVK